MPHPLPPRTPELTVGTFNAVANARAAIASLDSSARRLPNPGLLRRPSLRAEAQSTSALEGTYAPLPAVLAADDGEEPPDDALREVLNYVWAAEYAFGWHADGRPLTAGLLADLHGRLMRGVMADARHAGRLRDIQVVIGAHAGIRVQHARFVPRPPGPDLEHQVRDLIGWIGSDHGDLVDPVVAAGMAHYQFETLHPFTDGNGRIGRLLVVLHLLYAGLLTEPTLTISPWFEARRADYYDRLLAVSATGDWDSWIRFFAEGLDASAAGTEQQLVDLLAVQEDLKARVRAAGHRADSAIRLIDFCLQQPIFTIRQAERHLGVTYQAANKLVGRLVEAGVLRQHDGTHRRRFTAPDVLAVMLRAR
ncbi:MAG TPA: Fic/DOC family N-terminal domain-containing protein [Mycobacteriales bacterium]|nr:Fic/DOC family N-terminal domain-containing protein [Mycobacteriales bacterium]